MDAPQQQITVDPDPPPHPRSWLVLVGLALVAGVAVGVLIRTPTALEPTEAEREQAARVEAEQLARSLPSTPATTIRELRDPPPVGPPAGTPLRELVPGLEATLVVTLVDEDGEPAYQLVWPPGANGPGRTTTMRSAVFDVSATWFARIEPSLWNGQQLAIGDLPSLSSEPVIIGADSVVWHARDPARLAWTVPQRADARALVTGEVGRLIEVSTLEYSEVTLVPPGVLLVWWDEWGFVLDDGVDLTVLGTDGTEVARYEGSQLVWAAPDGTVWIESAGVSLIVRPSAAPVAVPGLAPDERITSGATDADGTSIALVVTGDAGSRVVVVGVDSGWTDGTEVLVEPAQLTAHTWTPDGSYLVLTGDDPASPEILFVDPDDATFSLPMADVVSVVALRDR